MAKRTRRIIERISLNESAGTVRGATAGVEALGVRGSRPAREESLNMQCHTGLVGIDVFWPD